MKEMTYHSKRTKEILHRGEYKEHKFCILSLGTHPVAYVECNLEGCGSYGDERLDTVQVHGGFTYYGESYWDKEDETIYLGWDYAHYMDYAGYEVMFPACMRSAESKKWTTAEIFEEVKAVITQLCTIEKGGVVSL